MNSSIPESEAKPASDSPTMTFRQRRIKYSWKTAPNIHDVFFGWAGVTLAIGLVAATIYLIISRFLLR